MISRSLSILACTMSTTAPLLSAADVAQNLTIGGYVDSVLMIADGGDAIGGTDSVTNFSAFAQLEFEYLIGDEVTSRIEISFDEDGFDADNFEEGHVVWNVSEQFSIISGKFENWLGWEGADAPELYRINGAYSTSGGTVEGSNGDDIGIYGVNTTGAGVIAAVAENIEFALFVVDEIYANPTTRPTDSISFGGYVDYIIDGLGVFQLDLMLGMGEANGTDDIFGVDVWSEIDALREDTGLLFAFDLNYTDFDSDSTLAFLAMVNYELPTEFPMSVTAMIDWIDPYQDDSGPLGEDDDGLEVAVAVLTNPTDDTNFAFNVEGRYISRATDDSNEYGLFAEILAVIP